MLAGGGWTGPRARFLLSGLMRCARCGSRYEGYTQRGKATLPGGERPKSYFYACGGYVRHGKSVCRLGELPQALLEGKVVEAVLDAYHWYDAPKGEAELAEVLGSQLGAEGERAASELAKLRRRIEDIDRTSAKLLDHLSAANRDTIDRRLQDLAAERERLDARAGQLERLAVDEAQAREVRRHTLAFVRGLPDVLARGSLSERQAALRRCIESVEVDPERRRLRAELRGVPLVAGGPASPPVTTAHVALNRGRRAAERHATRAGR